MKIPVHVRVTRKKRCRSGFYALINGQRLFFKKRRGAIGAIVSLLDLQRFQVITVADYATAQQSKLKLKVPKV